MDDFGNFDEDNFDANDDMSYSAPQDPFAAAGGMQMNTQSAAFAAASPLGQKKDDYTPEEMEIIERVD